MPLDHKESDVLLGVRARAALVRVGFGADAGRLARRLARAVVDYERARALGYYPALNSIAAELDAELLDAVHRGCRAVAGGVSRVVKTQLGKIFSSVRIRSVRNLMFNLPSARPGRGALDALAEHYAPDLLRVGARVTQIHRRAVADSEAFVANTCHTWLRDSAVELRSVTVRNRRPAGAPV